jgi:hypothetical protein
MEEKPEDHDFDQRKDGPLQRPSVQISTDLPRRTVSDEGPSKVKSKSQPAAVAPMSAVLPRRSEDIPRADAQPPRRSTQISRSGTWGRPSRDFDNRRDGPYGRPSITMTRRRSSQWTMPIDAPAVPEAIAPASAAPETAVEDTKEEQAPSDQVPPSVETMQSTDPAFEPEPPSLNYTLKGRYMAIFIFWSFVIIDSVAMPIVLYFCLWYLTDLSPNTVFSIVTAALGGISILEYFVRFWRLWKKGSTCRVIGARRMYLDWFHWNFSFAWIIIMIELIV